MKLDTSEYYPKSPLDDFKDNDDSVDKKATDEPAPLPAASAGETVAENTLPSGNAPEHEPEKKDVKTKDEPAGPIDIFCRIISWVFVPLLVPVYGIIMIFMLSILDHTPMSAKIAFTLVTFGFNAVLPSILVLILKKMGMVNDIGLNDQKERLIPYIITIACMGATALFMAHKGAPIWLTMFFAGGAVAGLVNLVVNFWWKISAHSAAVAGVVAIIVRIMHDYYPRPEVLTWLIIWIVISGLLGSARVWMGRHTPAQVLAGYAVGFFSVFLMTMIK